MLLTPQEAKQKYELWLTPDKLLRRVKFTTGPRGGILNVTKILPMISGKLGLRQRNKLLNGQPQYDLDVAMWWGVLSQGNERKRELIKRVFTTLFLGGLLYKKRDGTWHKWVNSQIPIAAALSHGGRVLIQLPESNDEGFWNWLWSNQPPGGAGDAIATGRMATHGVVFRPRTETLWNDTAQTNSLPFAKLVDEIKGSHNFDHYGVNIGLGGVGNFNPWTGVKIEENGEHGHLLLCYKAPSTDRVGALMVGCEGSAPRKTDQSGRGHWSGGSGEFSPTGGWKWNESSWHDDGPCGGAGHADKYNIMFVDLTVQGWDYLTNAPAISVRNLGRNGVFPPAHPNPDQYDNRFPSPQLWKLYSEVPATRLYHPKRWLNPVKQARASQLNAIDAEVETYNQLMANGEDHQKDVCLQVIIALCEDYEPSRPRRQKAKDELVRRATAIRQTLNPGDEVPGIENWLSWSRVSGPGGRRPRALRKIDEKVREYEALWADGSTASVPQKRTCLVEMALLCHHYDPQKVRRRVAKNELRQRALTQAERP